MGNNTDNRVGFLMLGLSLSIGLIISVMILSGTLMKIKSNDQFITVKGYAEKNIMSDLATWQGVVSVRSADLVSAYSRLQTDVQKVKSFLTSKGINPQDIKITAITTIKQYKSNFNGSVNNELAGYQLDQAVFIGSYNPELVETIANESTTLIQNGVEITSSPPSFFYTKINDLKITMLGEATKDAKIRAQAIAKSSNSEVGKIKSAAQGVFQITPINSTTVSDYGENDLSSMQKTIKAVVTADFFVK